MMPRSSLAGILRNPVLLGVPAVAFVFIFAIWPIADFLRESFVSGSGISLQQYRLLANSSTFAVVMARTLVTAVSVTFACVVLAYPMAYALTKARGGTRTVLIGLVALPYLTSVIVRTYAWAAILSLNGPVNSAMVALGLFDEPILLGHSSFGTWVGMTHILLPIATLTLWSAMQKIDPMQRLVAESLGASKAEAFLTVFVPQSAPGLASVASLVYILALGAYVIPAMLGGTRGLLFAQLVVEEATSLLNWNLSGAMAMVMLLAAAVPALMFSASRLVLQRLSTRKVVKSGSVPCFALALSGAQSASGSGMDHRLARRCGCHACVPARSGTGRDRRFIRPRAADYLPADLSDACRLPAYADLGCLARSAPPQPDLCVD